MRLHHIDHFTLRVHPGELTGLLAFYGGVLGLQEGPRPAFDFPGHWLYLGPHPIVHLAGNAPAQEPAMQADRSTGSFNHVSLRASDLAGTRARLRAHRVDWHEAPVPGMPLHQVFLRDPAGVLVELTFDAAECAQAGPAAGAAS